MHWLARWILLPLVPRLHLLLFKSVVFFQALSGIVRLRLQNTIAVRNFLHFVIDSWNHRIIGWFGLEGTFKGHLVHAPPITSDIFN